MDLLALRRRLYLNTKLWYAMARPLPARGTDPSLVALPSERFQRSLPTHDARYLLTVLDAAPAARSCEPHQYLFVTCWANKRLPGALGSSLFACLRVAHYPPWHPRVRGRGDAGREQGPSCGRPTLRVHHATAGPSPACLMSLVWCPQAVGAAMLGALLSSSSFGGGGSMVAPAAAVSLPSESLFPTDVAQTIRRIVNLVVGAPCHFLGEGALRARWWGGELRVLHAGVEGWVGGIAGIENPTFAQPRVHDDGDANSDAVPIMHTYTHACTWNPVSFCRRGQMAMAGKELSSAFRFFPVPSRERTGKHLKAGKNLKAGKHLKAPENCAGLDTLSTK